MKKKTLTIVLCQTRELDHTYNLMRKNLLNPLNSDLAYCGAVITDPREITLKGQFKFIWELNEPTDWIAEIDRYQIGDSWKQLVENFPHLFGGTGLHNSNGSGLIIMYWRDLLRTFITPQILEAYEWFVITRSDFMWISSHPNVRHLKGEQIYFLDGEKYGGVSDRHMIFHRDFANAMFSLAEPIFFDSQRLNHSLMASKNIPPRNEVNPEYYLKFRLENLGIFSKVKFLPYLGYTIRYASTSTRWSTGEYSERKGLYIKYPREFYAARIAKFVIRGGYVWKKIINNQASWTYGLYLSLTSRAFKMDSMPEGQSKIRKFLSF